MLDVLTMAISLTNVNIDEFDITDSSTDPAVILEDYCTPYVETEYTTNEH